MESQPKDHLWPDVETPETQIRNLRRLISLQAREAQEKDQRIRELAAEVQRLRVERSG